MLGSKQNSHSVKDEVVDDVEQWSVNRKAIIQQLSITLLLVMLASELAEWDGFAAVTAQAASVDIEAHRAEQTVVSPSVVDAGLVSDDFNSCTLDPRWTFVNPLGDGTMAMTGTQVTMTVPAGTSHNVFADGIPAPHIMQAVDDTDFEAVAKFESAVSQRFQVQGILVIQDEDPDAEDFIRFDFFHDGTNVRFYAATIQNGSPTLQFNDIVPSPGPSYYLKGQREGMVWTSSYSFDGVNFTKRNFTLSTPLNVTQVGVFVANHGNDTAIPAHTAIVDYFFNTASPIANEDGKPTTLPVAAQPTEGGTVVVEEPTGKTNFACGEQITLRANPADGWHFEQWSGSLSGSANPVTFGYNIGDNVTAVFAQGQGAQSRLYLPLVGNQ